MSPTGSIQRKNAISQQRIELLMPRSQTEILELRRQNGLYILRLNRGEQLARQKPLRKCRSMDIKLIAQVINPSLLADGLAQPQKGRDAEPG